jgi:hypothetical protein
MTGDNVISRKTPVSFCFEIAQKELVLQAQFDAGGGTGDLPGDKRLAPARGFVVEEDAVGGKDLVSVAV